MQRVATTVLALVGSPPAEELRELAVSLGKAANVRAALPDPDAAALDRAIEAWAEATGAHIPYLVHDADPLAEVAAAWVDRWEADGEVGQLEVTVQAVLQRWRARSLELPDYYLLVGPEALTPTARHWYLGVLSGAALRRVVATGATPAAVVRAISELRPGRWWPDLDALLAGIERRVPDLVHVGEPPAGLIV